MSYQRQGGGGGQGRAPANYLRTSSLTKTLHYNNDIDPATQKPRKEKVDFDFDVSEEISFTLTFEKAEDLVNRIVAAQNDSSGTGGIRVSMYCRRTQNQDTGEEFNGAGMLVYAQKPPQQGGRGGGFRGQSRGNFRGGGGGRRSYPPRQNQGYNSQGPAQGRGQSQRQQYPAQQRQAPPAQQAQQNTPPPATQPQQEAPQQEQQYTEENIPF